MEFLSIRNIPGSLKHENADQTVEGDQIFVMKNLKIGCVVMAAGRSSRFGSNKLLAQYCGRNIVDSAFDAVPCENTHRVVVVTRFPEVQILAGKRGFECVWNDNPEEGISHTIRLGLQQLLDADAVLFMVSDQVFLTRSSVSAMVEFYQEHPNHIICMSFGGEYGNPCIFPSAFFPELLALHGDTGGKSVIRRYESLLLCFEASDASELLDVDYPDELPTSN